MFWGPGYVIDRSEERFIYGEVLHPILSSKGWISEASTCSLEPGCFFVFQIRWWHFLAYPKGAPFLLKMNPWQLFIAVLSHGLWGNSLQPAQKVWCVCQVLTCIVVHLISIEEAPGKSMISELGGHYTYDSSIVTEWFGDTPLKLNKSLPNRKVAFQPAFFRGYVKLRWCKLANFVFPPTFSTGKYSLISTIISLHLYRCHSFISVVLEGQLSWNIARWRVIHWIRVLVASFVWVFQPFHWNKNQGYQFKSLGELKKTRWWTVFFFGGKGRVTPWYCVPCTFTFLFNDCINAWSK